MLFEPNVHSFFINKPDVSYLALMSIVLSRHAIEK